MNPLNPQNYLPATDGQRRETANIICSSIIVDNLIVGIRVFIYGSDVGNLDLFLN